MRRMLSVIWFSIRSLFAPIRIWFYLKYFRNAEHYLSYSDNIFWIHNHGNVTRSFFFGYWHQGHYGNYRKFKFRSNFVGKQSPSDPIKNNHINDYRSTNCHWRWTERRETLSRFYNNNFISAWISIPQYSSANVHLYMYMIFFFSISLWFYLHCRIFAETYSTARIMIVHRICLSFCWIFVCVFCCVIVKHTKSL